MFDLCNVKVFGGAVPCDRFNVARRCFPALKFCDRVGLEPLAGFDENVSSMWFRVREAVFYQHEPSVAVFVVEYLNNRAFLSAILFNVTPSLNS